MTLYFVNGSKQEKKLIETEYADDAYDTMIGLFEEHGKYPHFINMTDEGDDLKITFESQCEYFLLKDATSDDRDEFLEMMG
jgi:hypothetical protein